MSKLSRIFISSALFSILSVSPVFAQEQQLSLTLRDGVLKVLENNLDISIERISPEIEGSRIQREKGAYDPELFGSFKREDATTPLSARGSIAAGGITATESETYSFSAGVEGKLPIGTQYTLEVKDNWTAETLNRFEFEYESFTGVKITQPLLKDYGTASNNLQINLAGKNRDISIYQLKQRIIDIVTEYGFAYWDLVRAKEELGLREDTKRLAEALLDINRKKLEAGTISQLEVTLAEAAAATRLDDVIVARKNVKDRENAIKILITKDIYSLKDTVILPSGEGAIRPSTESFDESIKKAIAGRPDYLEVKSQIEKSNIQIKYASNQTFPKIDLEASYGYNGLGTSFRNSFDNIDSNPQWSLGVVFRYPLGNNTAKGDLRVARLEADQSILKLKRLEQQIILNVDNALKDINADRSRLEAARVSAKLSEDSLAAEEKKLAAGRSTTYNVLKVQEDLAKAKLNEINSIADFNKSLIRYHKEKGSLLEELDITLKDFPKTGEVYR
ncbi:MAG: TolC family protein [Deltaproteobacteria bacterium]|nr:TolC family protein [Deltaproteobacteria bacterium]